MSAGGLRDWLAAEIAAHGPMPVERYMRECLLHPKFGYYRTMQAVGAAGDFITAPEISQVFGELLGIWCAAAWVDLGESKRWRLVELGPGRGTLMADAVRALKVLPGARAGVEVLLVEANAVLVPQQRAALAGCGVEVAWLEDTGALAGLPPLPTILIANEFLDALPIRQFVSVDGQWRERCVALAGQRRLGQALCATQQLQRSLQDVGSREGLTQPTDGIFEFAAAPHPGPLPLEVGGEGDRTRPPDGAICEIISGAAALVEGLASLAPAYLLFIDYGHEGPLLGDSLQAVTAHRYTDPLAAPGEADLSAQVDFAQVRGAALAAGLAAHGPITQAELLGRLGAAERLERLARGKNAATVEALQAGLARLMQPNGMGGRFKALALASKGLARPPVF